MHRRIHRSALVAACVASLMALSAVPALAAVAASTGAASGVTATSATLNGIVGTGKGTATWAFQYGKTAADATSTLAVGTALSSTTPSAVLAEVNDLIPSTKYVFRLVTATGISGSTIYPLAIEYGSYLTFKTGSAGKVSLTSKKLKVKKGRVSVDIKCASTLTCTGKLAITAKGTVGTKTETVGCGKVSFTIAAGEKQKVTTSKVSAGCTTLLSGAPKNTISAKLKAKLTTYQPKVSEKVSLTS
jgi:hypothetical protein